MKAISWPAALVMVALLAAVVVLGSMGKDTEALIALGTLVFGGILYGKVDSIHAQSNGNYHRLVSLVERLTGADRPSSAPPSPPLVRSDYETEPPTNYGDEWKGTDRDPSRSD